jgi:hypothetical protein
MCICNPGCTASSSWTFLHRHAVRTWVPLDHAWNFLELISRGNIDKVIGKQPGLAGRTGCSNTDPRVIEYTALHSPVITHWRPDQFPVPAAPQRTTWLAPNLYGTSRPPNGRNAPPQSTGPGPPARWASEMPPRPR